MYHLRRSGWDHYHLSTKNWRLSAVELATNEPSHARKWLVTIKRRRRIRLEEAAGEVQEKPAAARVGVEDADCQRGSEACEPTAL